MDGRTATRFIMEWWSGWDVEIRVSWAVRRISEVRGLVRSDAIGRSCGFP